MPRASSDPRRSRALSCSCGGADLLPAELVQKIAACLRPAHPEVPPHATSSPPGPPPPFGSTSGPTPDQSMRLVCRAWRYSLDSNVRSLALAPTSPRLVPDRFPLLSTLDARSAGPDLHLPSASTARQATSPSRPASLLPSVSTLCIDLAHPHHLALAEACPAVQHLVATSTRTASSPSPTSLGIGGGTALVRERDPAGARALTSLVRRCDHLVTLTLAGADLSQFSTWHALSVSPNLQHLQLESCTCPWFMAPQLGVLGRGAWGAGRGAAEQEAEEAWRRWSRAGAASAATALARALGTRLQSLVMRACVFQGEAGAAGDGGKRRRRSALGPNAAADAAAAAAAAAVPAAIAAHAAGAVWAALMNPAAAPRAPSVTSVFLGSVRELTCLRHLDLSQNLLGSLHEGLGSLRQLETLNLSCNKIAVMPASTSQLTALKSLDLSHNHVEVVPEVVTHLTGLRELNLSRNWLNGSTLHLLSALQQLHTLDISYVFSMPLFPRELCDLTQLTHLSLKCTYVHKMPSEFSQLSRLQQLDVSFNSQLDHDEVCKMLTPLSSLQSLCMNHLDLEEFPRVLLDMTRLTSLELGRNRFRYIPPDVSRLCKLQVLNLQGSYSCRHGPKLCELAPALYQLTALRTLNLGCNFAGKLPPGIGQLRHLDTLCLSMNCLLRLPAGVEQLQELRVLDIRHNQFRVAPAAMYKLKGLRKLAIHGNHISADVLAGVAVRLEQQHCRIVP